MSEAITRCANCQGEERVLCDDIYEFTLRGERDLLEGNGVFGLALELPTSDRLDVTAAALQANRDEAKDCLRIIGCLLTREQIETNIMIRKG
jgi:hypothetical protein